MHRFRTLMPLFIIGIIYLSACTGNDIKHKNWKISYNEVTKTLNYSYKDNIILTDLYVQANVDNDIIKSSDYKKLNITSEAISDRFGKGIKYTLSYSDLEGMPDMNQLFYFYSNRDFFLTDVYLLNTDSISSNYIAPIFTKSENNFLKEDASNRVLRVPFDNDNFVHYLSSPLVDLEDVSIGVTSIFNGVNRKGIVVGAVEYDTWKTGIRYKGENNRTISLLECYGGVANELTRDVSEETDRPSTVHGSVVGTNIKSPKIFFGYFDDWRRGLEIFGNAVATVTPPRKWDKGTPFGWNSWAAMAENINYEGAKNVSDFVKEELQTNDFENDNIAYIGLDSFWDFGFSEDQLKTFVDHCTANGQEAGIYWCPFSDWHGDGNRYVEGTEDQWRYNDIYLYTNGKPRKIESLALDPTHPGTRMRIKQMIEKFKAWGYTYIKLDFINNAALEADSFYNPAVTTGMQAYNEGMKYLNEICGEDMFLALSIAPTFPSQYGTSRRISCDAWGAMAEEGAGTTGYMLNSLSFGWWLDRVYSFNDADHVLLHKPTDQENYQEGANRARITSAVITGIYMLGDNFSNKGSIPGDALARKKAKSMATNKDINDIARIGKSFYPVDGYKGTDCEKPESMYMLDTDYFLYLAVFNFNKNRRSIGKVNIERLGLADANGAEVEELWTQEKSTINYKLLSYNVPKQDVRVYRIRK